MQCRTGVNPLRNLSKWRQYLIQLLYASKGGVSKFLVKSALKRVLLRVGMRGAGSAVAFTNLLAVPIICIMCVSPPRVVRLSHIHAFCGGAASSAAYVSFPSGISQRHRQGRRGVCHFGPRF